MYDYFMGLVEARGVSVYKVAKDTGLKTSMFSNWKAGRYTPKVDKIKRIAEYFGVPLEAFISHSAN